MRLNTTGVISQPTEISVDGVITPGGFQGISCANVSLKYDPAKISITGVRTSGGGWIHEGSFSHPEISVHQTLLTSPMSYQWSTGPILYVTVSPVNGPVDTSDCNVLSLWGGGTDVVFSSNLGTETLEMVWVTGGCGGGEAMQESAAQDIITTEVLANGLPCDDGTPPRVIPASGVPGVSLTDVRTALMLAGGLKAGTPEEVGELDLDSDGLVTLQDAVLLARTPAVSGWAMFQGNPQRTGAVSEPIAAQPVELWKTDTRLMMPDLDNDGTADMRPLTLTNTLSGVNLTPSPIVVPNPDPQKAPYGVVYAIVPAKDTNGQYATLVYRIEEVAPGAGQPSITFARVPSNRTGTGFVATGTPMVVGNKLILTGNHALGLNVDGYVYALDATTLQPAWTGSSNPRRLPGTAGTGGVYSSPCYSRKVTEYESPTCGTRLHEGGAILITANSDAEGFMYALSLDTGRHVWGVVDTDGDLVPRQPYTVGAHRTNPTQEEQRQLNGLSPGGLPPLHYAATQSSVSAFSKAVPGYPDEGNAAYANDVSCWANARDLRTGKWEWEDIEYSGDEVQSTISVFDETLFWGGTHPDAVAMRTGSNPNALTVWKIDNDGIPDQIDRVFSTPAIHAWEDQGVKHGNVFLGDESGRLFSVAVTSPRPPAATVWWSPVVTDNGQPIYSSPLIAPDPTPGRTNVFVGGEDGKVHVINADPAANGAVVGTISGLKDVNSFIDPVRASPASRNGRLYVLMHGFTETHPVYGEKVVLPRVFCFGTQ